MHISCFVSLPGLPRQKNETESRKTLERFQMCCVKISHWLELFASGYRDKKKNSRVGIPSADDEFDVNERKIIKWNF